MRKLGVILLLFLLNIGSVSATNNRLPVTLSACVDGDTAKFILDDKVITARFLAIDTPESVSPKVKPEPFGKEASNYTCKALKNANTIEIEYDTNSDKTDKYNRQLVWVFIDNYLLQNQIIKEGLGEVAYLYGDYKYTPTLEDSEAIAKANKVGMWSDDEESNNNLLLIIGIIITLILFLLSSKLTSKQKKILKSIKNSI